MSYIKFFYRRPSTVSRKHEERRVAAMEDITARWADGDVVIETYGQRQKAATLVEMMANGGRLPSNEGVQTRSQAAIAEVYAITAAPQPPPAEEAPELPEFDDPGAAPVHQPPAAAQPLPAAAAPQFPNFDDVAAALPQPPPAAPQLLSDAALASLMDRLTINVPAPQPSTPPSPSASPASPPPPTAEPTFHPIFHQPILHSSFHSTPVHPAARRPPQPSLVSTPRPAEDAANIQNEDGLTIINILLFILMIIDAAFDISKYILIDIFILWILPNFMVLVHGCGAKIFKLLQKKKAAEPPQQTFGYIPYSVRHGPRRVAFS